MVSSLKSVAMFFMPSRTKLALLSGTSKWTSHLKTTKNMAEQEGRMTWRKQACSDGDQLFDVFYVFPYPNTHAPRNKDACNPVNALLCKLETTIIWFIMINTWARETRWIRSWYHSSKMHQVRKRLQQNGSVKMSSLMPMQERIWSTMIAKIKCRWMLGKYNWRSTRTTNRSKKDIEWTTLQTAKASKIDNDFEIVPASDTDSSDSSSSDN